MENEYLRGPAFAAGLRYGRRHGHRRSGLLGVLGVGSGGAVTRLFGARGGSDLHPLAASGGAVAVAVTGMPCSSVQPQQTREKSENHRICPGSGLLRYTRHAQSQAVEEQPGVDQRERVVGSAEAHSVIPPERTSLIG